MKYLLYDYWIGEKKADVDGLIGFSPIDIRDNGEVDIIVGITLLTTLEGLLADNPHIERVWLTENIQNPKNLELIYEKPRDDS